MKTNEEKLALLSYKIETLIRILDDVELSGVLLDENETKKMNDRLKECRDLFYE